MGCNNSQDLNAQKYKNDSEQVIDKKEQEEQTPSAGENCVEKYLMPSPATLKRENLRKHQPSRFSRDDRNTDKAQTNDLVKSDIDDKNVNLKMCTKATISESNIVDACEFENNENDNVFISLALARNNQTSLLPHAPSHKSKLAATKIQAAFRGHKVRATMKKSADTSVSAATTSQMTAINANAKEAVASVTMENVDPTKEEMEAEFDPNDKELCDAALKIQATFRGHLSRKLAGNKDAEDVDIQEITKKVAEELDIDLTDPELNKAATKIQASFRGHKSRKDAN